MKKLQIFVHGSTGKMGQNVTAILQKMKSVTIAYEVKSADVCIDFTSPGGMDHLFKQLKGTDTALISGTTGLSEKQFQQMKKASSQRAVLWSANFSPGLWAVRSALKSFAAISDFDFAINEVHHTEKLDNPSGTALILHKDLEKSVGKKIAKPTGQRIGGVFGIHTITAGSKNELIRLEHTAMNRTVFAQGAIDSAVWIVNQPPGYYSMDDFMTLAQKVRQHVRTTK